MGQLLGGGHVLAAARETGIAAAVIQNPFVDGRAAASLAMRTAGHRHSYRLAWRGLRDQIRARRGTAPIRVDLAGPDGALALMTTPDAVAGFESLLPADPVGWEPAVPARIVI